MVLKESPEEALKDIREESMHFNEENPVELNEGILGGILEGIQEGTPEELSEQIPAECPGIILKKSLKQTRQKSLKE